MYQGEPLDLLKRYNTYGDRLRNLGLPTLQYRRIRADLVETYKIINNVDKVDCINIFPIRKTNTRGHQHKIFKKKHCRTNRRKYSFSQSRGPLELITR
jgi:hypothetical protein